ALIALTGGKAKVITYSQDSLQALKDTREAFTREIKTCSGCKIVDTIPLALTDIGPPLQQKTLSALTQHPEANAVAPLYDGMTLRGGEGFAPNMDLIRSGGGQTAAMAFPAQWGGWGVIDGLNRVLNGLKPQNSGVGWQLVTKDKNLPSSGPWNPPVDYQSVYRKLWGLG